MLGLAILFVAVGLGFAVGYGIRGVVSHKRQVEYLAYAPYLPHLGPSRPDVSRTEDDGRSEQQPAKSMKGAFSILADRLGFALALNLALALLVILLLPRPS